MLQVEFLSCRRSPDSQGAAEKAGEKAGPLRPDLYLPN